jgi:hypothetical protein
VAVATTGFREIPGRGYSALLPATSRYPYWGIGRTFGNQWGSPAVNFRNPTGATRDRELSAVQRAGNRFGVTSVVFALLAALCAAFPDLVPAAWAFGPMGVALGSTGLVHWLRGAATNRDDALIGAGLAYLVVMVLCCRLAAAYPWPAVPLTGVP